MSDPLYVNDQVEIPGAELIVRTSRSTGSGGQHANVTESRVEVSFDIAGSPTLPEWARSRLVDRLGSRVIAVAEDERSQLRNREIARSRLAQRLRAALERPRFRRPTRPSAAVRERRLDSKRRQSQRKQERRPPPEE